MVLKVEDQFRIVTPLGLASAHYTLMCLSRIEHLLRTTCRQSYTPSVRQFVIVAILNQDSTRISDNALGVVRRDGATGSLSCRICIPRPLYEGNDRSEIRSYVAGLVEKALDAFASRLRRYDLDANEHAFRADTRMAISAFLAEEAEAEEVAAAEGEHRQANSRPFEGRLAAPVGLPASISSPRAPGKFINACRSGRVDEAANFLDDGLDPDARDAFHLTGLMYASRNGHVAVGELLLDRGASVDAVDISGRTALHHACSYGRLEVVRLLLDRGANINTQDVQGCTPLYLVGASEKRNTELKALLREMGGIDVRSFGH